MVIPSIASFHFLLGATLLLMGLLVFAANRPRSVNQAVAVFLSLSGFWAITRGLLFFEMSNSLRVYYARLDSSIGQMSIAALWLTRSAILHPARKLLRVMVKIWPILTMIALQIALRQSEYWMDADAHPNIRGPLWVWGSLSNLGVLLALLGLGYWDLKRIEGIRKIEFKFMVLSAGALLLLSYFTSYARNVIGLNIPSYVSGITIYVAGALMLWAMVSKRIFDVRTLLLYSLRWLAVMALVVGAFFSVQRLSRTWLVEASGADGIAFFTAFCLGFFLVKYFRQMTLLAFDEEAVRLQTLISDLAQTEMPLSGALEQMAAGIRSWSHAGFADILIEDADELVGETNVLSKSSPTWRMLEAQRWLTLESLQRSRPSLEVTEAQAFLTQAGATVMVFTPASTHTPAIAVMIGGREGSRPFTYPEITRLLTLLQGAAFTIASLKTRVQARQAGQLAALGLISATVAHEVKQPLAALRLFARLLPKRYDDPAFQTEFFPLIPREVSRMESILGQFIRIGQPPAQQRKPVRASDLCREVMVMLQPHLLDAEIELTTHFDAQDDHILVDPSAVKQALLNLGLIAIQAMNRNPGPRRLGLSVTETGLHVEIKVSDNGAGIPEALREKLFQPFSSSKPDGLGLGLYVTRDFVDKNGGSISVETSAGGTSFTIRFPSHDHRGTPVPRLLPEQPLSAARSGGGA